MRRKTIGKKKRFNIKKIRRYRAERIFQHLLWIYISAGILLVGGFGLWISKGVIYGSSYKIEKVVINHQGSGLTMKKKNEITKDIEEGIFSEKSYLVYYYWGSKGHKERIQKNFPLIKKIKIVDFSENRMVIDVTYHKPRIVRRASTGEKFGSYQESVFSLDETYVVTGSAMLHLPGYLRDVTSLEGIYHETSENDLVNIYNNVNNHIPLKHMIMYPGAGYVAMVTKTDIRALFSLKKGIKEQITLYENVYKGYTDAKRITQIDVGSLDDAIVTLRRE